MKKPDLKWEAYKAKVPGLEDMLQEATPILEDADLEFLELLKHLPSEISSRLKSAKQTAAIPERLKPIEHQWCLCEMAEGEFPRMQAYANIQGVAEAVAKKEGQDTAVWVVYGIPIQLTEPVSVGDTTKIRYLMLPNQKAAVVSSSEPFRLVDQSTLPDNLEIADDGWLGDPIYRQTQQFYTPGFAENEESFDAESAENDDEDTEEV
jgi:hypothetical protein